MTPSCGVPAARGGFRIPDNMVWRNVIDGRRVGYWSQHAEISAQSILGWEKNKSKYEKPQGDVFSWWALGWVWGMREGSSRCPVDWGTCSLCVEEEYLDLCREGWREVGRLKLRKCPELPEFSTFLARLPLGDREGGGRTGVLLRCSHPEV